MSLSRALLTVSLFLAASCASAGGPSIVELADTINATLEPLPAAASDTSLLAQSVTVIGEVEEPGALELVAGRRMTLVEAMARAGGYSKESAYLGSVVLVRWDPDSQRQLAWTIDARPRWWGKEKTVFLQPYDLLFVPNTPIDDAGIWIDNWIRRMLPIDLGIFIPVGGDGD
jgi:protein involved in polysaccharide export with SLBB domain